MIETTQPESPGWWLQRLLTRLRSDRPRYDNLDAYYRCENGIPVHAEEACKDAYKRLMRIARTNWAALSVAAPLERIRVDGFKTGASEDRLGDKDAWRIFQANELDAGLPRVFEASLSMSLGFLIVGDVDPDIGVPLITPEDPREVVVETDPRRRSRARAALKVYRDDVENVDRAYLYLPGQVWRAVAPVTVPTPPTAPTQPIPRKTHPDDVSSWEWESVSTLPTRIVPVFPFAANPTLAGVGVGEFEPHLPLLDEINYLSLLELEIATLQAFRQRAIQADLPDNDEEGNPIDYDDIFAAAPGALWKIPETAKMWESGQVDLSGIRNLVKDNVEDFAAVSGTPLFYLTPEASDGSAEGAALARERLIFKVRSHHRSFAAPLKAAMACAFLFAGDETRADVGSMHIDWAAPDRFSLSEKADAASKAMAGGMTWRATMEEVWQFSPTQIEEMEKDRREEALRAQGAALVEQVMSGAGSAAGEPEAG